MKFKFKQQLYQTEATNALVEVFRGQTKGHRKETTSREGLFVEEIFSNKKIELTDQEILNNVQELQKTQGIPVNKQLQGLDFSVEMETGTGKTYVYTKSMFELNKQYGWNKFIIMVPSIAIREGVHKSLEITAEHFQEIYGKKIRFSIYDTKNKSNLVNIKSFAQTSNIEVLIMNHQAFATKSKESRKIYQKLDVIQSERPIDIIKRARPILIIDEPQRFGDKAEKMLDEFNPLFVTRYSATHKKEKEFNKIHRLDAIDAYNQKLVKKIKVKGIEVKENTGTNGFLFLDRIQISKKSYPTAILEFEVKQKNGIKKILRKVAEKDDLFPLSGELSQYKGYVIKEINGLTNTVAFTNGVILSLGQTIGDVDEKHIRRIQIRETIKSHIEKERNLYHKGIKVLSLFFIDEVAKYRTYDENGNHLAGQAEYEKIFEEEYEQALCQRELLSDEYNAYLDKLNVRKTHNGYFSIDKKGKFIDSSEARGEGSNDVDAYDLIMKQKEVLLSFSEPTRFIFSHSALREGWDNPNIFQICTLKHSQSTISKRQEIGRGLRICVNNKGERMDQEYLDNEFFEINTLTVVASESYESFATDLQKEILDSLSGRPTKLTADLFKDRKLTNVQGETFVFDENSSMDLIFAFKMKGYIDQDYKITEKLLEDIETKSLEISPELQPFTRELTEILLKVHETNTYKSSEDGNVDNIFERELKPNENFAKKEFQDLWKKIKIKTVYDVDFETEELIKKSIEAIDRNLEVRQVSVRITEGSQNEALSEEELKSGEALKKTSQQIQKTESILGATKYDLIASIATGSNVTRKTATAMLRGINIEKFNQFRMNPEHFIQEVIRIVNEQKAATLINNITYHKTDHSYDDEVFTINNFQGSLKENILEASKHIYDYVKTDSKVERTFTKDLEAGEVLVYAKLPSGFKIPTPVGNYNPDWAIVFDTAQVKYIYFIAETKGSMSTMQLKKSEKLKIDYARKHFEALGSADIKYDVISTYEDLRQKVLK